MRIWILAALAAAAAAGCASPGDDAVPGGPERPSAPPTNFERMKEARTPADAPAPDPRSTSRVLGYVEGDVVTYREVLQLIGPELAQMETDAEKSRAEDETLLDIVRERMMFRAATDAGVHASRDEIESARADYVRKLSKNAATLEAFLREHDMTRHEFDEKLRRQLVVDKYQYAAIGRASSADVRVRPVTDTYVKPEEVRKYYDRFPEKFRQPSLARYRILTVKTDLEKPDRVAAVAAAQAAANAVRDRLAAGEDWVPVYRQTVSPDAQGGADTAEPNDGLLEIPRGKMAAWIEEFAFGAERGTLLVKQQGTTFYVLRAEGSHEARTIPFEEAEPGIRGVLRDSRLALAWLEVELSVLDQSSISPDSLRSRLRDSLRRARLNIQDQVGR